MASSSVVGTCRGVLLAAGAGAIVALAGIYVAKKAGRYFKAKRKMRLIQNSLLLSTRCAWFISELDAEGDFEMSANDAGSYSTECLFSELETLPYVENHGVPRRLLRQENDYQVVEYNPHHISREDFNLDLLSGDDQSDYGSQDRSMTPSISACVVNDEFTLIEGAAICMYLADLYGQFLPDSEHRAEYYSWIVYSAATFDNIVKTLHMQMVETPSGERNHQMLDSALSGLNAFSRALTETLSTNAYLCGDSFTAADCVLGFTLWWVSTIDHGRLLDCYPVLRAYLNRLRSRPAFRKTFGEQDNHWNWGQYFMTYIKEEHN